MNTNFCRDDASRVAPKVMAREYSDFWQLLGDCLEKHYENASAVRQNRLLGKNAGGKMALSGERKVKKETLRIQHDGLFGKR